MTKTYIVTAHRDGEVNSGTSYLVGAFSAPGLAIAEAEREESDRGGKFGCRVVAAELDVPVKDAGFSEPEVIREPGI